MENLLFLQFLKHPAKTSGTISSGKICAMISTKWNSRRTFDWRKLPHRSYSKQKLQSLTSKICSNRDSYRKMIIAVLQADPSLPIGGNNHRIIIFKIILLWK